jgi:hypothetical protein
MPPSDRYRGKAKECTEAAEQVVDPERRLALLELAQRWLVMAEQAEEGERPAGRGDALVPDLPTTGDHTPSPPLSSEEQGLGSKEDNPTTREDKSS